MRSPYSQNKRQHHGVVPAGVDVAVAGVGVGAARTLLVMYSD